MAHEREGRLDLARREKAASDYVDALKDHLAAKETTAATVAALFQPSNPLQPAVLAPFGAKLRALLPHLNSIVWLPRVRPTDADRVLGALKAAGVEAPVLFGPRRAPVPLGAVEWLFPVTDIEPKTPTNLSSLGLVINTIPAPGAALRRAEQTRGAAATAALELVQNPGVPALVLYVPVYEPGGEGRQPAGYLGFSYHLDRLIGAAFDRIAAPGTLLRVRDAEAPESDDLYRFGDMALDDKRAELVRNLTFGGRSWEFRYAGGEADADRALGVWYAYLAGGLALSFALSGAFFSVARSSERLQVQIAERERINRDLRETTAQFRAMGEAVPYGVWLCGPDGGARYVSPSFLELLDMSMEEQRQFGWTKRLVPEDFGPMMERWMNCVRTGEPWDHVHRIVDRTGEVRHVLSRGRPVRDTDGRILSWAGINLDITALRRAEDARQLLLRELNHRVKNLFSVAISMVQMTARNANSARELSETVVGRLMALAKAHDLIRSAVTLESTLSESSSLRDLVGATLDPHLPAGTDQLRIIGPDLTLGRNGTTSLALVLHELATNARKYGALSVPEGCLEIAWGLAGQHLTVTWAEHDGPPVEVPGRRGFGSQLTHLTVTDQLSGTIEYDWAHTGLRVLLRLPLDGLRL
ncbi:HWE histidine kinase domain-containing protein [Rhodoplanes sp. SY1]|uniref:HWE histidine kinase domain-containing protein n=1 Tax=Rhodoplanes sp. SY1 TaxID=3166646 RepID=UPI0038B53F6B